MDAPAGITTECVICAVVDDKSPNAIINVVAYAPTILLITTLWSQYIFKRVDSHQDICIEDKTCCEEWTISQNG
jgi:hypothetical protein